MDKKKQLQFNLNNFLLSFSLAFDSYENNFNKISKNQSKRVAFVSLKIAQKMNFSNEELSDLCSYSLIYNLIKKDDKNIYKFPFLSKDIKIDLMDDIVSMVHFIDTKFDLASNEIENRFQIIDFIKEKAEFKDSLKDYFLEIISPLYFWLDIKDENEILLFIYSTLNDYTIAMDFENILEMAKVIELKYKKDIDIYHISKKLADFYGFDHKDKQTFLIAIALSNLGKMFIPHTILKKDGALSKYEYEIVKSYPYYTKKVLSNIMGFNDICNWASKVQERLDGEGYPFGYKAKDLSLKERLLAVINAYSSLRTKKEYRDEFSEDEAIEILLSEALNNKLDKAIILDLKSQL